MGDTCVLTSASRAAPGERPPAVLIPAVLERRRVLPAAAAASQSSSSTQCRQSAADPCDANWLRQSMLKLGPINRRRKRLFTGFTKTTPCPAAPAQQTTAAPAQDHKCTRIQHSSMTHSCLSLGDCEFLPRVCQ
jgi:hypothetical protein